MKLQLPVAYSCHLDLNIAGTKAAGAMTSEVGVQTTRKFTFWHVAKYDKGVNK